MTRTRRSLLVIGALAALLVAAVVVVLLTRGPDVPERWETIGDGGHSVGEPFELHDLELTVHASRTEDARLQSGEDGRPWMRSAALVSLEVYNPTEVPVSVELSRSVVVDQNGWQHGTAEAGFARLLAGDGSEYLLDELGPGQRADVVLVFDAPMLGELDHVQVALRPLGSGAPEVAAVALTDR